MSVKNFSNTVDLAKMGIPQMISDIADLETVVGDEDSGLVKSVADLETVVGDEDSGLVKKVNDLETVVGDEDSGLVKKVNDLESAVGHMHGIYHQAYTADTDPITVTITFTEVIGLDTLFDIYSSAYGITPTSFSVSGQVATIVIPAQVADGVITLVITNPEMPI